MFNRHLLKTILSFCAVIISGLVLLVVLDSYKEKEQEAAASKVVPAPVIPIPKVETKTPIKKSTTTKPVQR